MNTIRILLTGLGCLSFLLVLIAGIKEVCDKIRKRRMRWNLKSEI